MTIPLSAFARSAGVATTSPERWTMADMQALVAHAIAVLDAPCRCCGGHTAEYWARRELRERYTKMPHREWFKEAYEGKPFSDEQAPQAEATPPNVDTTVIEPASSINENPIIHSGDLVAGKRYRGITALHGEVRPDDLFLCSDRMEPGTITSKNREMAGWFAVRQTCSASYFTAVQLVDEPDIRRPCVKCGALTTMSVGGIGDICLDCSRPAKAEPIDTGVIRAAEGVTLEPAEYEVVEIAPWEDHSPERARIGSRVTCTGRYRCTLSADGWRWLLGGTLLTAVRRVSAAPEPVAAPLVEAAQRDRIELLIDALGGGITLQEDGAYLGEDAGELIRELVTVECDELRSKVAELEDRLGTASARGDGFRNDVNELIDEIVKLRATLTATEAKLARATKKRESAGKRKL